MGFSTEVLIGTAAGDRSLLKLWLTMLSKVFNRSSNRIIVSVCEELVGIDGDGKSLLKL